VVTVEDHAYASALASEVVLRAKQREFQAVMLRHDNAIRMAMGYPRLTPPTEQEWAEAMLRRIGRHVRSHP
jgi:hypothetical protein